MVFDTLPLSNAPMSFLFTRLVLLIYVFLPHSLEKIDVITVQFDQRETRKYFCPKIRLAPRRIPLSVVTISCAKVAQYALHTHGTRNIKSSSNGKWAQTFFKLCRCFMASKCFCFFPSTKIIQLHCTGLNASQHCSIPLCCYFSSQWSSWFLFLAHLLKKLALFLYSLTDEIHRNVFSSNFLLASLCIPPTPLRVPKY